MNILVTINDNYMIPLLIMLDSLFAHEKRKMTIYLFYSEVSESNRKRLAAHIEKAGNRLVPVYVEDTLFQEAPVFRYFTREMYYRFLCGELLPKTVDRILYLDPDILIRDSVSPFYDMDFQGKPLIGVSDYAINKLFVDKKTKIGIARHAVYVNSGVLLFNFKKMRADFRLQDFADILEKNRNRLSFPDQDAMNLYFRDDIRLAERRYNYNTGYGSVGGMVCYLLGKREKKEPVIVHYMGASKPWQVDFYGKYFFEYYAYLKNYLNWKGRILFALKPCYVLVKMGKALCTRQDLQKGKGARGWRTKK